MLSLFINNLHVKLYSGVSIGVINRLGSVIDFNVSSKLLINSVSTTSCTDQMGKPPRQRSQWSGLKTSAESNNLSSGSSVGYKAPTAGYKDVLYSHGTMKATAMFGTVNTKISVQSWTGATIAGKAMEKLVEPMMTTPKLPSSTEEYKE